METYKSILYEHIKQAIQSGTGVRNLDERTILPNIEFVKHNNSTGEIGKPTFHKINIVADEIYSLNGYLLVIIGSKIKIYQVDSKFNLNQIRVIDTCYILYKKYLKKTIKRAIYHILINATVNGVYKPELVLEGIMEYLRIDDIDSIILYKSGLKVLYKTGTVIFYDSFLNPCGSFDDSEKIKLGINLKILSNSIEYKKSGKKVQFIIPDIKDHILDGNILFLSTHQGIIICEFKY